MSREGDFMSIDSTQCWMDLCEDLHYINLLIVDPIKYSNAVLEVLKCLNKKNQRGSILDVITSVCGEKYQTSHSLTDRKRLSISVSVVEY